MRFSRFERKILIAIAAVAIVPLLGALVLGQRALREAYEVGVNPRVHKQLEQGLALYREHFAALRRGAEQAADAIAADHALCTAIEGGDAAAAGTRLSALLTRYHEVARVRVVSAAGSELARHEQEERLAPDMRLLEFERPAALDTDRNDDAPHTLLITVAAPARPFIAYQRAGELVEVYSRLQSESEMLSTFFLVVYIGFLLSVIVAALAVGVALSRRVTRRVAVLADATARVGSGDLTVEVPAEVDDEISDLTKAFNAMVRDLRESRGRIEYLQRISAWQEFARRLAHEIKNPLTPIQLAAQEVHRSYRGDDPAYKKRLDDALAIVEEEVATLRRLVSEFSAFAKLPQAELQQADLGEFVRETERSLHAAAEEVEARARVHIECTAEPGALPVRIDAMMLKRAVDNLVRNSIQAIAATGPGAEGSVRVRARRVGRSALLEVADDGPGVPAQQRARVFDPYYTTKPDGTGLGLAIVKKIVLEHDGEIECGASALGGAEFTIRLPLGGRATPERISKTP
jgi:two-component system, NtrC family, nitrogen regulation sensor histidine kinase NtrY